MATYQLMVDPDGRVAIPDTHPGETITVRVSSLPAGSDALTDPIPADQREAIKQRVMQLAEEIRAELPEPWRSADHGDLLYGEDGLPR